jgi:hypothetical protein
MNQYAKELREVGYVVDCRWLQGLHQLHPNAKEVEQCGDNIPMEAQPFAQDDVEDLTASDAIVFFSEPPEAYSKRGGRHVEFGIAIALNKILIVIGIRENIFHCLPQVKQYQTWEEFKKNIKVLSSHPRYK